MSRRWPHKPHWTRIEMAYRAIAGSRWRAAAASDLRVQRPNLRAAFDRHLSPATIKRLDHFLSERLGRHAIDLDAKIERVINVRREIERGNYRRSTVVIETPIAIDGPPLSIEQCLADHPFAEFLRPLLEGVE